MKWDGPDIALAIVAALALGLVLGHLWPIGAVICVPVPVAVGTPGAPPKIP